MGHSAEHHLVLRMLEQLLVDHLAHLRFLNLLVLRGRILNTAGLSAFSIPVLNVVLREVLASLKGTVWAMLSLLLDIRMAVSNIGRSQQGCTGLHIDLIKVFMLPRR